MNCRLCALCCALALAFSLSACSGDKPITHASPTPAPTPSVSPTPSPSPSASEPAPEITPEPSLADIAAALLVGLYRTR